jgi:hypothetical protein
MDTEEARAERQRILNKGLYDYWHEDVMRRPENAGAGCMLEERYFSTSFTQAISRCTIWRRDSPVDGLVHAHLRNGKVEADATFWPKDADQFWVDRLNRFAENPSIYAIVEHTFYTIRAEPSIDTDKSFLGHGGYEFRIKFHDGRKVVTHNLWNGGTIPENFRAALPDNAVFLPYAGPSNAKVVSDLVDDLTPEQSQAVKGV